MAIACLVISHLLRPVLPVCPCLFLHTLPLSPLFTHSIAGCCIEQACTLLQDLWLVARMSSTATLRCRASSARREGSNQRGVSRSSQRAAAAATASAVAGSQSGSSSGSLWRHLEVMRHPLRQIERRRSTRKSELKSQKTRRTDVIALQAAATVCHRALHTLMTCMPTYRPSLDLFVGLLCPYRLPSCVDLQRKSESESLLFICSTVSDTTAGFCPAPPPSSSGFGSASNGSPSVAFVDSERTIGAPSSAG